MVPIFAAPLAIVRNFHIRKRSPFLPIRHPRKNGPPGESMATASAVMARSGLNRASAITATTMSMALRMVYRVIRVNADSATRGWPGRAAKRSRPAANPSP